MREVYDRVVERGEGIDVLVNNAGFGWYGYASDMPADTVREMIQVNNEALAQLIVLFLPIMRGRGQGHVINVSSIVGGFPSPWAALYSATKAFIDSLSTALYREHRGTGVHISAVRPGPVVTDFYRTVTQRSAGRSIPVGRSSIQPGVVADAIVGLLRRPRRAVYVPRKFSILPWVELGFGWLFDRLAGILMRRAGVARLSGAGARGIVSAARTRRGSRRHRERLACARRRMPAQVRGILRIRSASSTALSTPCFPIPMVATGTPRGSCRMESRASMPDSDPGNKRDADHRQLDQGCHDAGERRGKPRRGNDDPVGSLFLLEE